MFGLMGVARMAGQPGGAWSPLRLFAASEQGAWYDPSDFSSMFQDSIGTTPVTAVEQPVGLILDKRLGLALGAEIITNGDFSGGTTGWTFETGWEVSGGTATKTSGVQNAIYQIYSLSAGKTYAVDIDVVAIDAAGSIFIGVGDAVAPAITTVGHHTRYLKPTTGSVVYFTSQSNGTATVIDNISVREIPGNHASQPTAAARPVVSARVNLLTYSEDLSNAVWAKLAGATVTGTNLLNLPSESDSAYNLCVFQPNTPSKVQLRLSGSGTVSLNLFDAGYSSQIQVTLTATPTIYTHDMLSHPTCTHMFIQIIRAVGDTATSVTVTDVQMETGSTATRYQRVTTASDYDTVGFPHYLVFDGVDDALANLTLPYSAARTALGAVLSTDTGSANRIFAADTYESVFNNTVDWGYYATSTSSIVAVAPGSRVAANVVGYEKPDNSSANTVNGLSIATAFVPYATTPDGYILASEAPVGGNRCAGRIYGLVVTNYMQTEAQRQALARYLADKAGITL